MFNGGLAFGYCSIQKTRHGAPQAPRRELIQRPDPAQGYLVINNGGSCTIRRYKVDVLHCKSKADAAASLADMINISRKRDYFETIPAPALHTPAFHLCGRCLA